MTERRRDSIATRNERTKLTAAFINARAIGFVGLAILNPSLRVMPGNGSFHFGS